MLDNHITNVHIGSFEIRISRWTDGAYIIKFISGDMDSYHAFIEEAKSVYSASDIQHTMTFAEFLYRSLS